MLRKAGLCGGFVRNERFAWATNVLKDKTLSIFAQVSLGIVLKLAPPRGESNAPFREARRPSGPVISQPSRLSAILHPHALQGRALPRPDHQARPQPPKR